MITKKNSAIIVCLFFGFQTLLIGGDITGKITIKTDDETITKAGKIFIGDLSHRRDLDFPDYLRALVEATKSQRFSTINSDGEFNFQNVPEGTDLLIGINFENINYFIKTRIEVGQSLTISKEIDITKIKSDYEITVRNQAGIGFGNTFAGASYCIHAGSEGWVLSGTEPSESVIRVKGVPDGSYIFTILSGVENGPDRCDSKALTLSGNGPKSFTFNVE